jgi:hypothetical protein
MQTLANIALGASIVFTGVTYLVSPRAAAIFLGIQASGVVSLLGAYIGVRINMAFTDWFMKLGEGKTGGGNGTPQLGIYLGLMAGGGIFGAFVGCVSGFGVSLYVLNRMFLEK